MYWALRDYGVEGQWGLEKTPQEYLDKMAILMKELKRVLKPTGSCWINLGDTYGGSNPHAFGWLDQGEFGGVEKKGKKDQTSFRGKFVKPYEKSLTLIPFEFAINCRNDGWIVRNNIIWYKSNSMPMSVKDRLTNKYEFVFFMTKKKKYYFNLDAIRVPTKTESEPFNRRIRDAKSGKGIAKLGEFGFTATEEEKATHDNRGVKIINEKYEGAPQSNTARLHRDRPGNPNNKQDNTLGIDGKPKPTYEGFNERWKNRKHTVQTISKKHPHNYDMETGECLNHPNGKNPGDVFFINPKPFAEAHFATFPVDLPLTILSAACPPKGTVLDPFFGSGTVGVAAEMLALNWIGIELKKEYIDIAKKRLEPYMSVRLA